MAKLPRTVAEVQRNGRAAPEQRRRPSFTCNAGYVLHYRHLSPDTLPRLQAAARTALAESRPLVPTQRVETAPGEWRDEPNPFNEEYQQALSAWEARVVAEQGVRFLKLCEEYALIYEIDKEEVAALRAAHAMVGDPLDEFSDAYVFLWHIALPTHDDQFALSGKLFGGLTEEAVNAQKAAFQRQLQRSIAQESAG